MSRKWLLGFGALILALLVLAFGGTWLYLNVFRDDAPDTLQLPDQTNGDATIELDGRWVVTPESMAGYRVDEILFGQAVTAVGRTSDVSGSVEFDGDTARGLSVVVDMTSVVSDEPNRDQQYRTRIMDTEMFPTSQFEQTDAVSGVEALAENGATLTVPVRGEFTVRGQTQTIEVDVDLQRSGDVVQAAGSIPIVFADYGIPEPSIGAISVDDNGVVEFLITLEKDS
ncbi:YceI family protein [Hoyosella rhizosphaerae]|uniref:Lipid/polyisoprenoid-binding YceI-like domain-containing protein n=1 Tax=Hoyosella rhizosphaerae TaxID=1755582 RepID=A0A916XHZ3_9ACTN|nr:YceI family protein [Hoyosella rhizosphaerae]MBN4928187.1 YceI family protein [Hoyosella rhizosphaerae]GGC73076.1 hypothetical protein GCM10011410_27720 [Hoyosella rhizosphaerae]